MNNRDQQIQNDTLDFIDSLNTMLLRIGRPAIPLDDMEEAALEVARMIQAGHFRVSASRCASLCACHSEVTQ